MKRLGRQPLFWDETFFRFLKIDDPILVRKLTGGELGKEIKEE